MTASAKPQGTWYQRIAVRLFTAVLAVLMYWVLGFLVDDIRALPGPDYSLIEQRHLNQTLVARQAELGQQVADLTRQIENQSEKQRVVGDSSRSLQQTINQLLDLQKLSLQQSQAFPAAEQTNFTTTLTHFLENQKKYQDLSQTIADLIERKQGLVREQEAGDRELQRQRQPAQEEYSARCASHRLKLACLQLAILLPLLLVAAVLMLKRRGSLYFPLYLAGGAATLFKVARVMHEYFPSRYFKYLLIGSLLLVVGRLLISVIRSVAFPKAQWLLKQYREAYERFLCPVCDYPIRLGPRRFLFWTRGTVNKIIVPSGQPEQEEAYTCPACGHALFAECSACHRIRHVLLPHCAHCGAAKEVP